MKVFTYKPQPQGENEKPDFNGEIKIEVPKRKERLKLMKEVGFKTDSDGQIIAKGMEALDYSEKLAEIAAKHVKELAVTHVESGEKFTSFDELEYTQEGTALIMEIGNVVLSGIRLGKN